MSDTVAEPEEKPGKSGKKSLILAVVLALAGGGGGFYAVNAGLIPLGQKPGGEGQTGEDAAGTGDGGTSGNAKGEMNVAAAGMYGDGPVDMRNVAFVEVDPVTISLNEDQSVRHLRFRAQLEVNADYRREVFNILPRVTDVMNSYLRALELDDLTGPMALTRLRAQMLRRVQVVTGKGRVQDLLIMEFVLN